MPIPLKLLDRVRAAALSDQLVLKAAAPRSNGAPGLWRMKGSPFQVVCLELEGLSKK